MWIGRVNTYSFVVGFTWGLVWFNFVCLLCFHLSKRIFKSCGWSPKRSTACWKRWRFGPHCAPACILGVRTRIRSRQNLQPLNTAESSPVAHYMYLCCIACERSPNSYWEQNLLLGPAHFPMRSLNVCYKYLGICYNSAQSGSAEHFAKSFSTHASSVEVHAMAN